MEGLKISAEKRYINREETLRACDLVKQFIIDNNLVIYGGMSLDFALKNRGGSIYPDHEIPDYDFYSSENVKNSTELHGILVDAGFAKVSTIPALHPGVIKGRVGSEFVSDIAYADSEIMQVYIDTALTHDGMMFKHPFLQIADTHDAFSKPFRDSPQAVISHRWVKDMSRYLQICAKYNTDSDWKSFTKMIIPNKFERESIELKDAPESASVLCGDYAYRFYMKEAGRSESDIEPAQNNTFMVTKEFFEKLKPTDAVANDKLGDIVTRGDNQYIYPAFGVTRLEEHKIMSIDYTILYYYSMFTHALKKQKPYEQYAKKYIDLLKIAMTFYPKIDDEGSNKYIRPTIKLFGNNRKSAFMELFEKDKDAANDLQPARLFFDEKYHERSHALDGVDIDFKYNDVFGL